jgi:hypothetical protein
MRPEAKLSVTERQAGGHRGVAVDHAQVRELDAGEPPRSPEEAVRAKLAEPLRDLAAKVAKEGQDGNLTVGKLKVTSYRVDVLILLRDTSEQTVAALKALGFEQTGDSKAVTLLIGTIDVRKLDELARLDAVIRVKPVAGP